MFASVKIQVKPEEIIEAVKGMEKKKREAFLEDLLAATSPEYLKSIREARADYRARRVRTHEEVPRVLPVGSISDGKDRIMAAG